MLDFRSPLIWSSALAGVVLACLGWLFLGGAERATAPLTNIQARLDAAPASRRSVAASPGSLAAALSPALLVASGGDIPVRLDGLSKSPHRMAALVSINNGPPQWLAQGATREGVTLVQVLSTKVLVDSRAGRRTIALGETSGVSPDLSGADASDQPPPGVRLPPPPASAPGAP